jgi:hypothetical protein
MKSVTVDSGFLLEFLVGSGNNEEMIVSRLLFADDTLNFCDANCEQIFHLFYVLKWCWC